MREHIIKFTLSKILEERAKPTNDGYVFMWNIEFEEKEIELLKSFGYVIIPYLTYEHSEYVIFQDELKDKTIDEINKITYQKKLDREEKIKQGLSYTYSDLLLLTSYFRRNRVNEYESDESALNKYLFKK